MSTRILVLSLIVLLAFSNPACAAKGAPVNFAIASILDSSGSPLSGGKVYFLNAGASTVSDVKAVYTDESLTTPAANPVILDAMGRMASIRFAEGLYKVAIYTSADVSVITYDNFRFSNASSFITSTVAVSSSATASSLGYTDINVLKGGMFVIAAGQTFTIDVPFSAGLFQCLNTSASGSSVSFSAGMTPAIHPQWFGPGTTPGIIQKAITASPVNGIIDGGNEVFVENVGILVKKIGLTFRDMRIDAKTTTAPTGDGTLDPRVFRSVFTVYGVDYVRFTNVHVDMTGNATTGASAFLYYENSDYGTVENCSTKNTPGTGIDAYDACNFFVARENFVYAPGLDGILIHTRCNNGRIIDNTVQEYGVLGIEIEGRIGGGDTIITPCYNMIITGNTISYSVRRTANQGILVDWSDYITVADNTLTNTDGIHLLGCSFVSVDSNTFNNGRYAIIIDGEDYTNQITSYYVTVSNNTAWFDERCPGPRWPATGGTYCPGAYINNAQYVVFTGNHLYMNDPEPGSEPIGLFCDTMAVQITVSNNVIKGFSTSVYAYSNVSIDGNNLDADVGNACILTGATNLKNLRITNNVLSFGVNCINLDGGATTTIENLLISGNTFQGWGSASHGLFIFKNLENSIISNNMFNTTSQISLYVDVNVLLRDVIMLGNFGKNGNLNGESVTTTGNIGF